MSEEQEAQAEEQQKEQEAVLEEQIMAEASVHAKEALFSQSGAPSPDQIEKWKTMYGDVFISPFGDTEMYIWRPIFRKEYIQLRVEAQKQEVSEDQMEEMTCDVCRLWPAQVNWAESKAGTLSTLTELIMQNSNFIPPHMTRFLAIKL